MPAGSLGASTIVSGRMMAPMLMAAVTGPCVMSAISVGAEGEAAVAEEGRVVAEGQGDDGGGGEAEDAACGRGAP